ncbi:GNAT family N-acetyltransferase [Candidatus Odyssella acanthamoebae]|uniref:GNAT family N-acetyltransferase n=1 Tax=Candidatus Odyssella acanthamoebae TaxID=91604 RepID=UPI00069048CD|nr:GNAT family N-acetyltransferase [Candidatus Paracaedibacter acanthamoebae]
MLETMNRYIHGYVAVPVILSCRERGLFDLLKNKGPLSCESLAHILEANDGHLRVALRMFESLNWIKKDHNGTYTLTLNPETSHFIQSIPQEILSLYKIPTLSLFKNKQHREILSLWLTEFTKPSIEDKLLWIDFFHGAVVVPLLLALKEDYLPKNLSFQEPMHILLKELPSELQQLTIMFFINKGWAEPRENNNIFLTNLGRFLIERAFNMATGASYAPMLGNISELLYGDPKKVFKRDDEGHELHVDRTLNVLSSGFQHERYFADVEDIIISIFNQEPFENQPRYVIDMGCGDGTFLKKIYELICTKTARGKALQQYPIAMIGVDYNQKSLDATETTLQHIPHYTLQGDISDPKRLMNDLKLLGLPDPENCLHVRSFLDHDRPFLAPASKKQTKDRSRIPYQGVYVNTEGKSIAPNIAAQSLVEHFGRWSSIMTKHGLVILEVHSLTPEIVSSYLDENESFHFDAYHAFSMQHLIEADVFLLAAAETGLFPKKEFAKKYPLVFPYTRITLNYLEKRPYTFSNAQPTDLADLVKLEAQCWPEHLRAPEQELNSRLERFPEGQFVIKQEEKIVGVIYTQRITDMHLLSKVRFDQVGTLHDSLGDTLQLLGFNIVPEMQDRGFGDQILEFVLQLAFSKSGIKKIVGVTRCKNYKGNFHIPINEYVQQHIDSPEGIDPILRFHTSHGAKIVNILQTYRPEDIDNQGAGILIEYNPNLQRQDLLNQIKFIEKQSNQDEKKISDNEIFSCILEVLPQRNAVQFSPTKPLREMGFDSLGLLELRTLINQRFGLKLDSTFFFEYGTPALIATQLHNLLSPSLSIDDQKKCIVEKKISDNEIFSCILEVLPQRNAVQFSPTKPLREMGFDSLGLLELRTLINQRFGLKLDSTFFFEYGTPALIATQLHNLLSPSLSINDQKKCIVLHEKIKENPQYGLEPIAIVGMACRLPGNINNIDDYWRVLREGKDAISKAPSNRLELQSSSQFPSEGGYLTDIDKFDPAFFNISPREAELMDPQQRILLEVTWEALEQAGINAKHLHGTKTGVYIGIFSHDYEKLINKAQSAENLDVYYGTGNSASVAAGRLSYVLGLRGPSIAINTACSSSLVAVHLACQSLRQGESQLALAGGVNLILSPELSISFSKSKMLSADGRCKTFDVSANGYGRSEGCGLIVLKRLSQALQDRDNILGIIRSSAVNQDGASNGLTAPNQASQIELINSALGSAHIDPQTISYIEAHGTGTPLGDPIEVKALMETYGLERKIENPLFLGSAKTNIGHTEAAAGIAGLIKVVLALKHQLIPPHLHFTRLNPHIDFGKCDVQIPTQPLPWPTFDESPRRGAVSSFGFSGTNAHVVIEEGPGYILSTQQAKPYYLLALSAKHPNSLKQQLEDLHSHLKGHANLPLEAIAYTLNMGRNHFDYRCAFVVSSIEELQGALEEIKQGKKPNHYLIAKDKISMEQEPIFEEILGRVLEELPEKKSEPSTYYKKLLTLADLYIKGYSIDWEVLHQGEAKQRISLPTYPFLKERYWIEHPQTKEEVRSGSVSEMRVASASFASPSLLESVKEVLYQDEIPSSVKGENTEVINPWCQKLLLHTLQQMGFFDEVSKPYTRTDLRKQLRIILEHERLFFALIDILIRNGWAYEAEEKITLSSQYTEALPSSLEQLEQEKVLLSQEYPELQAYLNLLWTCVKAYPEILRGEKSHMEVMFPGGSIALVEGIYKGSSRADYYNEQTAQAVKAYVRERLKHDPQAAITILEIGAGTGGTSTFVLKALEEFKGSVHYIYTDISLKFLHHGEEKWKQQYPWMSFKRLDIEASPHAQDFSPHSIDLILASNVLHATKRIDATLKNVKELLKANGLLVLNEINERSDFLTLTFGLTEGWWLFEDAQKRIPFSPILTQKQWREELGNLGFYVALMPYEVSEIEEDMEQRVILAESDGVITQDLLELKEVTPRAEHAFRTNSSISTSQSAPSLPLSQYGISVESLIKMPHISQEEVIKFITANLVEAMKKTLKLPSSKIDINKSFSEYGVDSLVSIELINQINTLLKISLRINVLFDHATIVNLSRFILSHHGEKIREDLTEATIGTKKVIEAEVSELSSPKKEKHIKKSPTPPHDNMIEKSMLVTQKKSQNLLQKTERLEPTEDLLSPNIIRPQYFLPDVANKKRQIITSLKFPELIHLNQVSQGQPVFWFHPGLGGVQPYYSLAQSSQRPFYGIQAKGWNTEQSPLRGIQTMAAYYAHIIQSIQPEGPYDLGGYSLGGIIAYEVARQLQEFGQTVSSIVMVDSPDTTVLKHLKFSSKSELLHAANYELMADFAQEQEFEEIVKILIHREEVNATLEDKAFLKQLKQLLKARGLKKTANQLEARLQKKAKVCHLYEVNHFSIQPLANPQEVCCYYFRNKSGLFFGELEPYYASTKNEIPLDLIDHANYWREWENQFPKFYMTDVDSSSHISVFSEPQAYKDIIKFCEDFYSAEGAEESLKVNFRF